MEENPKHSTFALKNPIPISQFREGKRFPRSVIQIPIHSFQPLPLALQSHQLLSNSFIPSRPWTLPTIQYWLLIALHVSNLKQMKLQRVTVSTTLPWSSRSILGTQRVYRKSSISTYRKASVWHTVTPKVESESGPSTSWSYYHSPWKSNSHQTQSCGNDSALESEKERRQSSSHPSATRRFLPHISLSASSA